MHIDWLWLIPGVIAAIIINLIRSLSTRVTELEKEVWALREKVGIAPSQTTSWPPPIVSSTVSPFSPGSMPEVENYIRQNQKINAIKVYREQTGVGLKEAKDAVEDLERRMKYGA